MDKMRLPMAASALAALNLFSAGCAFSQGSPEVQALKKEVEALKKDQQAMQKDLEEIKGFLEERAGMRPQPKNLELSVDGSPYMGDKNAKVTVIEFSDYQCPFCARHFSATLPQIVSDYVKTGKVKYVLLDFPLQGLHPAALRAAEAAHCAGEQGKYWEMHDRLLNSQRALGEKDLPEYAKAVGADVPKFEQCVSSGKYEQQVRRDEEAGRNAGVSGTPSFFLGLTRKDEAKIKVARMLVGAQPYPSFKEAIDGLLASP